MNFEHLFKRNKNKNKNFFLFYVENVIFYDIILFQNISLKINELSSQDNHNSFLNINSFKIPYTWTDTFLILLFLIFFYYIFFEFLSLWYKENIVSSNVKIWNDLTIDFLFKNNFYKFSLSPFCNFFSLNMIEFLNYYNH